METIITGSAAPVALACVALLGYLVGRRQRRAPPRPAPENQLDRAQTLIAQVEQISDQLRRSMAAQHSRVSRCQEQFQRLSQAHEGDTDPAHHIHWQEVLVPTQRLSDDIAHAYDELRRHTLALRQLRG